MRTLTTFLFVLLTQSGFSFDTELTEYKISITKIPEFRAYSEQGIHKNIAQFIGGLNIRNLDSTMIKYNKLRCFIELPIRTPLKQSPFVPVAVQNKNRNLYFEDYRYNTYVNSDTRYLTNHSLSGYLSFVKFSAWFAYIFPGQDETDIDTDAFEIYCEKVTKQPISEGQHIQMQEVRDALGEYFKIEGK